MGLKIAKEDFEVPQMSVYLDDYILNEKFILKSEESYK